MEQAGKRDLRIRTNKHRISDKEIKLFVQLLYVALKLGLLLRAKKNRLTRDVEHSGTGQVWH